MKRIPQIKQGDTIIVYLKCDPTHPKIGEVVIPVVDAVLFKSDDFWYSVDLEDIAMLGVKVKV